MNKYNLLAWSTLVCGMMGFSASASTIGDPSVAPNGSGGYTFTYGLTLDGGIEFKAGDFFTIYDFAGLTDIAAPNDNWGASTAGAGDASNATFTYIGSTVFTGSQTGFSIDSVFSNKSGNDSTLIQTADASISGLTHGPAGISESFATPFVPQVPTPEPASMALLGLGFSLVGLMKFRKRVRS
jgi:hypothetical protein